MNAYKDMGWAKIAFTLAVQQLKLLKNTKNEE
jgi:hypothetical protein